MALLVAAATFLIAVIAFLAIWLYAGGKSPQEVIRQRMEAVRKAEKRGEISEDLALVRDETYSSVPILHRALMRLSWSGRLRDFIAQAGMSTRPAKILLWSGVLGLSAYVGAAQIFHLGIRGIVSRGSGLAGPRCARGPRLHHGP
jgi:hypothetical protein